ncbi:mechanosensitive ion channel [Candidatus Woesearchaeota archaeon]|nr:mechanosensitive ion channel [Candidatus Woesearchaeota archaeon]
MIDIIMILSNEYLRFVLILTLFFGLAWLVDWILTKYVQKYVESTKTSIDDLIVEIIRGPVHFYIIVGGIYLAFKSLSVIGSYANWLNKGFIVISIWVGATIIASLVAALIDYWLESHKRFKKTPQLLNKIFTITIYFLALIIILGYFNVEITPLLATLGVGGLAIGLALQKTLSDFFAGLNIISERQINVGDHVQIENEKISGYIDDIGWRSTKIKSLRNNMIIVPNSSLSNSIVTNNKMPHDEMSIIIKCGVAYSSNLNQVEKITLDVAKKIQKKIEGAKKEFEPLVRFHTFGESNIEFSIILRVEHFVDQYRVKHEFIKALKDRYDQENIEISWPVRKIYYDNQVANKLKLQTKPVRKK